MCLYMLVAAGAVGTGEHPSAASRLQPSKLLRSLQQLHPERRRAVHLSSTWVQVKHPGAVYWTVSVQQHIHYTRWLSVVFQTCAAGEVGVFRERTELHGPSHAAPLLVSQWRPEPVHTHRLRTLSFIHLFTPTYLKGPVPREDCPGGLLNCSEKRL